MPLLASLKITVPFSAADAYAPQPDVIAAITPK
jgi:hypothetical protein